MKEGLLFLEGRAVGWVWCMQVYGVMCMKYLDVGRS